eukprot:362080-Chlamydomonas_euryale.AAC.5
MDGNGVRLPVHSSEQLLTPRSIHALQVIQPAARRRVVVTVDLRLETSQLCPGPGSVLSSAAGCVVPVAEAKPQHDAQHHNRRQRQERKRQRLLRDADAREGHLAPHQAGLGELLVQAAARSLRRGRPLRVDEDDAVGVLDVRRCGRRSRLRRLHARMCLDEVAAQPLRLVLGAAKLFLQIAVSGQRFAVVEADSGGVVRRALCEHLSKRQLGFSTRVGQDQAAVAGLEGAVVSVQGRQLLLQLLHLLHVLPHP